MFLKKRRKKEFKSDSKKIEDDLGFINIDDDNFDDDDFDDDDSETDDYYDDKY